jgi:hypothetical protein
MKGGRWEAVGVEFTRSDNILFSRFSRRYSRSHPSLSKMWIDRALTVSEGVLFLVPIDGYLVVWCRKRQVDLRDEGG